MVDEQEIHWLAQQFLRQHGADAAREAAARIDALLTVGDVAGARAFKRLHDTLDALIAERGMPPPVMAG